MNAVAPSAIDAPQPRLVAPTYHTFLLIALFLCLTVGGALFQRAASSQPRTLQQHHQVAPLYVSLIGMEWGLLYFVWKGGLRRSGTKLAELIGGRWRNWTDVSIDVVLALGLWAVWMVLQIAWQRWFVSGHAASIQQLMPQRVAEILLWVAVSISAGICEEITFRGYFQKQFYALTRSKWVALFMQAALFGISHAYQGPVACLKIALYGVLFGLLALWRQSLRPGMMAHALTDIIGGLF